MKVNWAPKQPTFLPTRPRKKRGIHQLHTIIRDVTERFRPFPEIVVPTTDEERRPRQGKRGGHGPRRRMGKKNIKWIQSRTTMDFKKVVVEVNDPDDQLVKFLEAVRDTANPGHSFPVIIDPDNSETRQEFGFDGDGSFHIKDIKVSKGESAMVIEAKKAPRGPDIDYPPMVAIKTAARKRHWKKVWDKYGDNIKMAGDIASQWRAATAIFMNSMRKHGVAEVISELEKANRLDLAMEVAIAAIDWQSMAEDYEPLHKKWPAEDYDTAKAVQLLLRKLVKGGVVKKEFARKMIALAMAFPDDTEEFALALVHTGQGFRGKGLPQIVQKIKQYKFPNERTDEEKAA